MLDFFRGRTIVTSQTIVMFTFLVSDRYLSFSPLSPHVARTLPQSHYDSLTDV
jgi:hypothetical protein